LPVDGGYTIGMWIIKRRKSVSKAFRV
jgi:hypothetical protein